MKTTTLLQFVKSLAPGDSFKAETAAAAAGLPLTTAKRRLGRSELVKYTSADRGHWEVIAEVAPKASKTPTGDKAPKGRTERRAKRKADPLEVRAKVQAAPMKVIGVDAIESRCSVTRRESFKEARARVSRKAAQRVTTWKSKGERVVTVLGVAAFR